MSPGVTAAIFPHGPGRAVYNKALLAGGLSAAEQSAALETMAAAYADAGVPHYAAWVHETETALREDLEQCDYTVESSTRAMGMALSPPRSPAYAACRDPSVEGVRAPVRIAARPPCWRQ